jgi:hypothetical protein
VAITSSWARAAGAATSSTAAAATTVHKVPVTFVRIATSIAVRWPLLMETAGRLQNRDAAVKKPSQRYLITFTTK